MEIVVGKAYSCGISCPSEPTSGRLRALIHWGEAVSPSSEDLKDTLFKVKKEIKANQIRSPYPHGYHVKYPTDPRLLPEAMKAHAFRDGLPGPHSFTGLDGIARLVKLRAPKGAKAVEDMEARLLRELRQQFVAMRSTPRDGCNYGDLQRERSFGFRPEQETRPLLALQDEDDSVVPKLPDARAVDDEMATDKDEGADDTSVVAIETKMLAARAERVLKRPATASPKAKPAKQAKHSTCAKTSAPDGKEIFTTYYSGKKKTMSRSSSGCTGFS